MNGFRNGLVLVTFVLTTADYYQQFVVLLQNQYWGDSCLCVALELIFAVMFGALTAHVVLSLWHGTHFITDLVDYEPEPALVN